MSDARTHAFTHTLTHTHTQAVRLQRGRAQGSGRGPLGRRAAREELPRPADHRQRGRGGGSLPVGQQGGVSVVACVRVCVCTETHTHMYTYTRAGTLACASTRTHAQTRACARLREVEVTHSALCTKKTQNARARVCIHVPGRTHVQMRTHTLTHSLRRLPRASQRLPRRGWRALPPSASLRRSRRARRRILRRATPPRPPWRPRRRGTRRWA